ncbi:RNase P modulator RnpM [Halobacillus naozhouensis]|uniref:YlxR family protein n=1 Tax=Halobacillus naozhouensis TaxID=554880 RepID=A0ABY8J2Q6_9BACI|nr:YlxR family protein [Halobacillus naozhouensis]WFT76773.1 YlxR family protein [Halobacillus naozhouensis]
MAQPKQRKIPLRKCVVTQEMKPKKQLIRVVRNKDGEVFVDQTGKKNGRGAYISKSLDVIDQAEKQQVLNRHLNAKVNGEIYEELRAIVEVED